MKDGNGIEVVGKNGTARIMSDARDENAISHLYALMSSGLTEGSTVRVMADYHEGKGAVIGFTQRLNPLDPRICPNVVGVDIGCRVTALELEGCKDVDFPKLDKFIRDTIPLGAGSYDTGSPLKTRLLGAAWKDNLKLIADAETLLQQRYGNGFKTSVVGQLFSLGSGNHYIEVDRADDGNYWLNVHSGSRNFGLQVATTFQAMAVKWCPDRCADELKYLSQEAGELYHDYLTCVQACQTFSAVNHGMILCVLRDYFVANGWAEGSGEIITTLHNYIDLEHMIVRKGAISAQLGEKVLIPFNMRDGIAVCVGKGNEEYNYSAPHGCGRLMSRSQAKKTLNLDDVKRDMHDSDVFTTSLDYALDEAPDAYKDCSSILDLIGDTVDVLKVLKPVYNIKGK